jgi:FAD synthetase
MAKKVLVFGTFDGLHSGHLNFFRQAKKYGSLLHAVVAKDATVRRVKGCLPLRNEKKRLAGLKENVLVDKALLGFAGNPYRIIEKIKPDVIVLGYDQESFTKNLPKALKEMGSGAQIYRAKSYKPEKFHSRIIDKRKCTKRKQLKSKESA